MTSPAPAIDINIQVIYANETFTIKTDQLINQGGEAMVFEVQHSKLGRRAIKIIHLAMRSGERFKKLIAQIKRKPPLPSRTVSPDELVYDANNPKDVIGFGMEYIDISQYEQLIWWTKQEHRLSNQITFDDIVNVMYEVREEFEEAHDGGYLYGDFNPKGILVLKKKFWTKANQGKRVKIVDADACVFDGYVCEVFTLEYLDPRLWPKIKQKALNYVEYDEASDNWAFMAIFFQVITTVCPWHGYHPTWQQNMKALIARNLTVLHQKEGVEYPPNAVPLDQLPLPFQQYFKDIQLNNKRYLIGEDILADALGIASKVNISTRPAAAPVPVTTAVSHQYFFKDLGLILDFFVSGSVIHVLAISNDGKYMYITYFNGNVDYYQIHDVQLGHTYRILSDGFVSEVDPTQIKASVAPFRVYNIKTKAYREEMSATGIKRYAVVAGGNGRLHMLSGGRVQFRDIQNASDIYPGHTVGKNSDVKADIVSGNQAGYNLNGLTYSWFFTRKRLSYDIPISPLRDTEFMTNWDVLWGDNSALLVRQTEYQGNVQTRLDEVELTSANVSQRIIGRPITLDELLFRPINGAAYIRDDQDGSSIIYATPEGIVTHNLLSGDRQALTNTKGLVNSGQALRLYSEGILAIGDGEVKYITF
jgi:hypothetical protein